MQTQLHIRYTPHPGAKPEAEISALAAIYRFILFESNARKKATEPGGRDDREGFLNERRRPPM